MPLSTARKLYKLFESGQLKVMQADSSAQIHWDDSEYEINSADRASLKAQAIIEAVGQEFDATRVDSELISSLLKQGTVERDSCGGIKVDPSTLQAAENIYAIGSLTRGSLFYVTAIDRCAAHAERIADALTNTPERTHLHVAFFLGTDVFSHIMISKIVPQLINLGHIPFIFLPEHKASKKSRFYELRELAFFERQILQDHIIPHLGTNPTSGSNCLTVDQLGPKHGILVQKVADVNDPAFLDVLNTNHIDLGFSIRCYQKFGKGIIQYFESQQGLQNMHPGQLPQYRGVMTTVRAIANNDPDFGYSLHQINEDWDAGALLDVRKHPLNKSKAMLNTMEDMYGVGVEITLDAVDRVARDQEVEAVPQKEEDVGYWTFPTEKELKDFRERGIRLVDGEGMQEFLVRSFSVPGRENELRTIVHEATRAWYENNAPDIQD